MSPQPRQRPTSRSQLTDEMALNSQQEALMQVVIIHG